MIKQTLTSEQREQISKNLLFIDLLTKVGKYKGYRVVIAGGYAVDGSLGEITRPHNDLDIQIYGKNSSASEVIKTLLDGISVENNLFREYSHEDKGRKEYYHNIFIRYPHITADTYYMQVTTNPFDKHKIIVKDNGKLSEIHEYETQQASLENKTFEIQLPLVEIVDKLYKRDHRGDIKLDKHLQDIKNLEEIVSDEEIQKKLQKMLQNSNY